MAELDEMTKIILSAGQQNGLEIWRVEKFELVPVPKKNYGEFFSGDSYVILYTYEEENPESGELEKKQNIHWWIGEDSTQDEYGAAAIIAVMMDDANDGLPVQCRETMFFESKLFQSYFGELAEELGTKSITYKLGGVESGFNHVEVNGDDSKRILRVKGRGNKVYSKEVAFSWDSLTCDDVYIFEVGSYLWRWKGPKANMFEWNESNQVCKSIINDEQAGRGEMESLSGDDKFPRELLQHFEADPPKEFPESGISDKDADAIKAEENNVDHPDPVLFKISNESGDLETTQVGTGEELNRDLLDTNDCFVLDCGNSKDGGEIYIWKGKESNLDEKKQCMKTAIKFVKNKGYGQGCNIMVFVEKCESEFFKQHFDWK